jgi:hypothetical protein
MCTSCSTNGKQRNPYRILVGKLEGTRSLGIPGYKWEDNIKMNVRKIGWGGIDSTDLAQDMNQCRVLANTAMNFQVP